MFVGRVFLVLLGSVLNNFALQYVKPVHFGVGFAWNLEVIFGCTSKETTSCLKKLVKASKIISSQLILGRF